MKRSSQRLSATSASSLVRAFVVGGLAGIALLFTILLPGSARASKPKIRLERLDPALLKDEQIKLYATAVELEGNVLTDFGAAQFTLLVDGKPAGRALKAEPFSAVKEDVNIALVVEVAAQYKPAIEQVKESLQEFLDDQPKSMKVTLIPFGSDLDKTPFLPAPALSQKVGDLSADDDSVEVRLNDAVRLALTELKKLDPKEEGVVPPRKLIVVISDGLNAKMDRPSFKKLGEDAAKAGVPIHTIAFSPIDERGPLLNLGEMSKRSNGTFRWAQKPADLKTQLGTLADEVRKQYVLTFKTALTTTERHTFGVRCDALTSNILGARGQFGGVVAANAGFLVRNPWILWTVGGGVGLFLVLLAIAFIRTKLEERPARAPKAQKAPAATGKAAASAPVKQRIEPLQAAGRAKIEPLQPAGRPPIQPVAAPARSSVAPQAAGGGRGSIVAIGGGLGGQRIQIQGTLTLGKAAGNNIHVTDDPAVSGRHAELCLGNGGLVVKDLGSTNGTFVNANKVSGTLVARDGDIVRFGQTQFKVRID